MTSRRQNGFGGTALARLVESLAPAAASTALFRNQLDHGWVTTSAAQAHAPSPGRAGTADTNAASLLHA